MNTQLDEIPCIAVNPHGHLYWQAGGGEERWPDAQAAGRAGKAFAQDGAAGLLHLVSRELQTPLPAALAFWRALAHLYVSAFCHDLPPGAAGPPPAEELAALLGRLPPMKGGEYVTAQTLEELWAALDAHMRAAAAAHPACPINVGLGTSALRCRCAPPPSRLRRPYNAENYFPRPLQKS